MKFELFTIILIAVVLAFIAFMCSMCELEKTKREIIKCHTQFELEKLRILPPQDSNLRPAG